MLKSFANIIELDIASPDTKLIFVPRGGVWIAPINEIVSNISKSYFNDIVKINEAMLYNLFNIGSITVIDANSNSADRGYVEVFNWEDLYNQNKSYFQYKENGISYIAIHFNNFETIYTKKKIIINIKKLFCTREWTDNNNKLTCMDKDLIIEPRIEEIDTVDIEGEAITFSTIQTNEISITFRNEDGLFDDFINIYGNRLLVKRVFDGVCPHANGGQRSVANEDIKNSTVIFSGFVEKPEYSFLDTVTITASDIRASFTTEVPSNVFLESKYPYLKSFPENVQSGEDIIDTARTLAAGKGIIIKLKPIKYYTPSILEPDDVPEVVFEICDTSRHAIENIVSKTDILDNKLKPHVYFIETPQSDNDIIEKDGKIISGKLEIFIPEFKDYGDGKGNQRVWTLDKERGLLIFTIFIVISGMFFATTKIYAAEKAIDESTESKIIELKDNAASSLADYQDKYGSNIYGFVAYILNLIRIYSIPLCFLGIAIGAIHQYVIGIRKLDTLEKGMALIVSFVTILIICQILPLAFAVFVKFGRG